MGPPVIFLALLLFQSALSLSDDALEDFDPYSPDEEPDAQSYLDRKARNDKFLRFGRRFWDYESSNDVPFDDSDAPRPPRTGRQEKNDHFIRFGRSKQDSLRLNGNPQQRTPRDKASFLRFGRSITTEENKKKRGKREAMPSSEGLKRHENYLRFGRNSNFMRFGRNFEVHQKLNQENLKQMVEVRNARLLDYIKDLLKQSQFLNGHNDI